MANIHPTAIVEEGARLADSVTVGAYAYIGSSVAIGENTVVDHSAHINGKTTIGKNNKIFPHASLGTVPQDLRYKGEDTELIIGDNNSFREFSQVNIGTVHGGGVTKFGDNNLIMGHTHFGHDVIVGNNCIFANMVAVAGHVIIGDFVVIGGLTGIHQFAQIGSYSMVAAASALSQDVPPFVLAEGNRAVVRGLNLVGLRRHFDHDKINALKPIFKLVFRGNQIPKVAAQNLLKTDLTDEAKLFCEFVANSKRGVPVMDRAKKDIDE